MEEKKLDSKIRGEDKKAFGKFIWIMLACFVGGGMIGGLGMTLVLGMNASGMSLVDIFEQVKPVISYGAAWILIAYTILLVAVLLIRLTKHMKQFQNWDGEDEEVYEKLDKKLSIDLLMTNILMLGEYLLFGIAVTDIKELVLKHAILFVLMMVFFLGALAAQIAIQQKIVNFYKKVNPEKQGSVYDMKFNEKWYESCDEAERAIIGAAAKKALGTVNTVCMVLEVILIMCSMFFSVGIMAHVTVIIIWTAATVSYVLAGNKLGTDFKI